MASEQRTRRTVWGLAALAVVALAGLGFARLFGAGPPAAAPAGADLEEEVAMEAPAPAMPPVAAPAPPEPARPEPEAPPPVAAEPPALPEDVDPRVAEALSNVDEETRARWAARVAREQAARARFEAGVEESQVRARDIDTRLREALGQAEFVPELVDGGLMTGLRIRSVEPGSPLAEAGLREGDLLVSIGEDRLDDPAKLPRVLADAGPEPFLCVERAGGELCRELALR